MQIAVHEGDCGLGVIESLREEGTDASNWALHESRRRSLLAAHG
jgi:hypothetical protein